MRNFNIKYHSSKSNISLTNSFTFSGVPRAVITPPANCKPFDKTPVNKLTYSGSTYF